MELAGLSIADDPRRWGALGFALTAGGAFAVGGVRIAVAPPGEGEEAGIRAWALRAPGPPPSLDGLRTQAAQAGGDAPGEHPNGAVAVDHVVVRTPDLDRTMGAFAAAGLDARRVREAGELRQAFYVLRTALAEVAGPATPEPGTHGPAAFWGLTIAVADLDATAALLGDRLGTVRPAVQPGRRIATVAPGAAIAVPVAFMTPRT